MYIHLDWVDLVAGYDRLQQASHRLISKWRGKLMAAYPQKMANHQIEISKQKKQVLWIGGISVLLGLAGNIHFFKVQNLTSLCLLGTTMVLFITSGILWIGMIKKEKDPPGNPMKEPLKSELLPDLHHVWRDKISASVPTPWDIEDLAQQKHNSYGLIGELNFIRSLSRILTPQDVILHSLQQNSVDHEID